MSSGCDPIYIHFPEHPILILININICFFIDIDLDLLIIDFFNRNLAVKNIDRFVSNIDQDIDFFGEKILIFLDFHIDFFLIPCKREPFVLLFLWPAMTAGILGNVILENSLWKWAHQVCGKLFEKGQSCAK